MSKPQKVPLNTLVPYWRNPRNSEPAIPLVMESITAYQQQVPIIVDQQNVIIAGHSTYKALMRLEEKEAWVVVSDMTPEQAKEYRIVDNKTAELAVWNRGRLADELKALGLGLETVRPFFDPVDLGALLGEPVVTTLTDTTAAGAPVAVGEVLKVPCPHCGEENQIDRRQFA